MRTLVTANHTLEAAAVEAILHASGSQCDLSHPVPPLLGGCHLLFHVIKKPWDDMVGQGSLGG